MSGFPICNANPRQPNQKSKFFSKTPPMTHFWIKNLSDNIFLAHRVTDSIFLVRKPLRLHIFSPKTPSMTHFWSRRVTAPRNRRFRHTAQTPDNPTGANNFFPKTPPITLFWLKNPSDDIFLSFRRSRHTWLTPRKPDFLRLSDLVILHLSVFAHFGQN